MLTPLGFAAAGFVLALPLALALGGGRLRRLGLAFAGVVVWSVWSVYALAAPCEGVTECLPELGIVLGAFVLSGWLLGVVCATAIHSLLTTACRERARGRSPDAR